MNQQISYPDIVIDDRFTLMINKPIASRVEDLFSESRYTDLHKSAFEKFFVFRVVDVHAKRAMAVCHYAEIDPGVFRSPGRASYGGWAINENFEYSLMDTLNQLVEKFLIEQGAKEIKLTLPPVEYDPVTSAYNINSLYRMGYQLAGSDLNYSIHVDPKIPFDDVVKTSNRRRIKKCRKAGVFTKKLDFSEAQSAYDVICRNRQHKGYPVTLSWQAVSDMIEHLPERTHFFGAFLDDKIIAGSLGFQISSNVYYVFYWGGDPEYLDLSPVSILAGCIYDFCVNKKFKIMDIGISSLNSEPNENLIQYKEKIGCKANLKLALSKRL